MVRPGAFIVALTFSVILGCSSDSSAGSGGACDPDSSLVCECMDGSSATQRCLADGSLGACECLGALPVPTTTAPGPVDPPVADAGVTEPPVTEPPVTEPPESEPPVTEPPVTEPPVTEPPPMMGIACGDGWGTAPIPGSIDLGLATNPETPGVPGGLPEERAMFDQINAERMAAGIAPLTWSEQVANVARSHAADINQIGYFDHGSSTRIYRDDDGNVIRDNWLPMPRLEFVYPGHFRRAGENIARYPNPVERVVPAWMNSSGHRAAILDEYGWTATHGGVGMDGNTVVFSPAQCQ